MINIKQLPWHKILLLLLRVYLGLVFIFASYHKILHPVHFALDIATYDILPLYLINLTAITLPWVELIAGLLMISGFKSQPATLLVALMMLVFTIALSIALHKGIHISCGCFASSQMSGEEAISIKTLYRDLAWLSIAIYILIFDKEPLTLIKRK